MLETATLGEVKANTPSEEIEELWGEVERNYSEEMVHVLRHMLKDDPSTRPTFANIKEYIEQEIQIAESRSNEAENALPDEEDQPS